MDSAVAGSRSEALVHCCRLDQCSQDRGWGLLVLRKLQLSQQKGMRKRDSSCLPWDPLLWGVGSERNH